MTYKDKALEIIDKLKLNGYVNNRERGVLRRALIEERPQGEWINPSENPDICNKDYFYDCLICGCTRMDKSNFCPNCGADMRGGRE